MLLLISFELCFATIILEFNRVDVFSSIIFSTVLSSFGSQSRWSRPMVVTILASFSLKY
tara:strand:- start:320 stop:496 length:177 start_codon:yes stop_codon:yes gene_type:complete